MLEKIKDYWQWIVGGLLAILAIAASKKRDSKEIVKAGDSELEKNRNAKIIEAQENIYEQHLEKRSAAQKKHARKSEEIAKIKSSRQKELENNPDELDRILKEKYKLKGD